MCMSTGRIYIRLGKDYCDYPYFNNLETLIEAVALSVKFWGDKPLVKIVNNEQVVCLGQTKKYIASEATRLIDHIKKLEGVGHDHMAIHVSKRQINRLIRICKHKDYRLSCYSLVILHIIYTSINKNLCNNFEIYLTELAKLILKIADNISHRPNFHSDLVTYILDSYPTVKNEIDGGEVCNADSFPSIHRWKWLKI